ncbi:MAG: nucleotidyltransferase [Bacteroidota bacterium]|nr:nucleotidyltransferase [Bacteroidota bacterium]MDP4254229.1 nucleotidyltransferase [Bacteroidota bacterium]MDP4260747.1 nucleotidyltransferase [Bacteroidota bacterium]
MDIFDEEILKFWAAMQNCQVKYIMVGGYATNLHGYQRYTGDIDIWIKDARENRQLLRNAFIECGMGDYYMLETMQFVPGWTDFHLMNGLRLDIMLNMKGLEEYSFEECLNMASIADIDGVKIPFLHINHLIANKKAVNRPKDKLDVIELERIRSIVDKP